MKPEALVPAYLRRASWRLLRRFCTVRRERHELDDRLDQLLIADRFSNTSVRSGRRAALALPGAGMHGKWQ